MNLYNQIKYNGYHINIYYDDDARSPREAYDNLGTLYTAHRATARRRSSMTTSISTRFLKGISKFPGIVPEGIYRPAGLPLRPWRHYNIHLAVQLPVGFRIFRNHRGTVGQGTPGIRVEEHHCGTQEADRGIPARRNQYLDNYYTGEVFGYRIMPESDEDNELDSCWGFYGTECLKELEAECRHIIDGWNKAGGINRK